MAPMVELAKASGRATSYGALQSSPETRSEEAGEASRKYLRMAVIAGSIFASLCVVFLVALVASDGTLSYVGRTIKVSIPGCTWCVETPAAEASTMTAVAEVPAVVAAAPAKKPAPKLKQVKKVRTPATKMLFHRSLKGPQQLVGSPDGTILSEAISVGPVGFSWIHRGGDVPTGWHCVHVYFDQIGLFDGAPLNQAWADNFICATENLHMEWSTKGPIHGRNCVQIYDDKMGGHVKNPSQYYLCLPLAIPYDFSFFQYGKLQMAHLHEEKFKGIQNLLGTITEKQKLRAHMDPSCLIMTEHDDVYAWDTDNLLCITYASSVIEGGISWGGTMSLFERHMTAVTCAGLALVHAFRGGRHNAEWWELTTQSEFADSDMRLPGENVGDCVIKFGPKELTGGHARKITGVTYYCGDGLVNVYYEDCDDGNREPGDGCNENCKTEPGYYCTRRPQGLNHCEHIAQCEQPLPDRCACTLAKGFCDSLYEHAHFLVPQTNTIYDFYSCQSCCADAIHPCATDFGSCPHEMKPAVQECNKKCIKNFGRATCEASHFGREWWENIPIANQHVAGAKIDLLALNPGQYKEAGIPVMFKFYDRVKMEYGANVIQ